MNFAPAPAIRRVLSLIPLLTATGIPAIGTRAQEPARSSPDEAERTRRLAEMTQIVRGFQTYVIDEKGNRAPAVITSEPLHRWTDPTREFSGGALWAWKHSGRPIALVAIELYGKAWSYEFVSLSTGRLTADDARLHWAPSRAGIKFEALAGAPDPAADEAGRLRQMKALARRFEAREFWAGRYNTLRLLTQPIDRYADPASGAVDGTIFTYANGTNPELLLLVEARREGDAPAKWCYAAAPLAKAALYLKLGSEEVWTAPIKTDVVFKPEDTYFIALTPRERAAGQ
jgi:hypothetical protein